MSSCSSKRGEVDEIYPGLLIGDMQIHRVIHGVAVPRPSLITRRANQTITRLQVMLLTRTLDSGVRTKANLTGISACRPSLLIPFSQACATLIRIQPALQSLHEQTYQKVTEFEHQIGEMMKFRGTTDLVVLNSTATAMLAGGFPVTQIFSMARTDSDVASAVLLSPALKYGLEIDQKTRDSFKSLVEQQTLGSDYDEYQNAQKQADLVSDIGTWLMDDLTGYTSTLNDLEQGRVVAIPEAG